MLDQKPPHVACVDDSQNATARRMRVMHARRVIKEGQLAKPLTTAELGQRRLTTIRGDLGKTRFALKKPVIGDGAVALTENLGTVGIMPGANGGDERFARGARQVLNSGIVGERQLMRDVHMWKVQLLPLNVN